MGWCRPSSVENKETLNLGGMLYTRDIFANVHLHVTQLPTWADGRLYPVQKGYIPLRVVGHSERRHLLMTLFHFMTRWKCAELREIHVVRYMTRFRDGFENK